MPGKHSKHVHVHIWQRVICNHRFYRPDPFSAGEGYRFLEVGETIQDGDEFDWGDQLRRGLPGGKWVKEDNPFRFGSPVTKQNVSYRRKVGAVKVPETEPPKTQYRILNAGEILKKGDEYF